ncbi:MAG: hypothetical protein ACRDZ6_11395 [Acidimicrobiales bacterium]
MKLARTIYAHREGIAVVESWEKLEGLRAGHDALLLTSHHPHPRELTPRPRGLVRIGVVGLCGERAFSLRLDLPTSAAIAPRRATRFGLLLFKAAVGSAGSTPPALWLLRTVFGTLVVVAALTALPARLGIRQSPAEVLASEAA